MTRNHLSDPAELKFVGTTPAEVRARLQSELDAFEAHLAGRQHDWTRPQTGRDWSPAQEAEHVLLINQSITPLLRLLGSDRELRPMPQVPGTLKGGKRQAPPASLPSEQGLAWEDLQGRWAEHRQQLEEVAQHVTGTPGRTYWHPFFGELDALDWLRMVTAHLYSHRKLLEKSLENGAGA